MESVLIGKRLIQKGLDQLGVKHEERSQPFEGASGVTHPLIAESVTQFQAQAYKELLPSGGPVKTQVVGFRTRCVKSKLATRVKDFMNYQIMEVMEEFDPDMDQLLFYLPLSGSTFKKVYFDEANNVRYLSFPAQDLVVPYAASDLATASRVTACATHGCQ